MNVSFLLGALDRRLRPAKNPRPWDLPQITLDELMQKAPSLRIDLTEARQDPAAGTLQDGATLALLTLAANPARVFEIGTGFGRSTSLFARHAPQAEIFTLSLPANPATGRIFKGQTWAAAITQLEGDSLTFDYSPWKASIDFVLVDGCHEHPHVAVDTQAARTLCSPRGWIVWHDAAGDCPDVLTTLLALRPRPFWIKDTRFAVLPPEGALT